MKTFLPLQKLNGLRSVLRDRRGIALVIVLAMLVLLSGLLVAFITTATTERNATQASSDSATTRQIADSTVNLVLGQIREATTPQSEGITWASQPGAIRTYSGKLSNTKQSLKLINATNAYYYPYSAGKDDYVFRLYSAKELKSKSEDYSSELRSEVNVIESWDRTKPDPKFVDLNEPILTQRTDVSEAGNVVEPHYPIIDPRAKYFDKEVENTTAAPGIVDGFDAKITKDPQLRLLNENNGAGAFVPYIPMPVEWLYVLKDGSIGGANRGTISNPIIGRTAFWTDDESSKLNINTASEGTFWDTPSVSTEQDCGIVGGAQSYSFGPKSLGLGASQPVRGEYQRYPGHPFTTSLSPVLGWIWKLTPTTDVYPATSGYLKFKEAIYRITPFTPSGNNTTKGATVNTDKGLPSVPPPPAPVLSIGNKHLYANVDELMFNAKRTTGGANGSSIPNMIEPNLSDVTKGVPIKPSDLEKVRFFLTATSRAPDINLFGRPRVTLWPIAEDFKRRTNFDDLFAFSSTIYKNPANVEANDKRFYLTRSDAKSDKNDLPSNSSQNGKMYEYLQFVTSKTNTQVPGFGGSFEDKFRTDRDQILTEIFDYGRCTNLVDTGTATKSSNATKFFPYTPRFYKDGYNESYGRFARSVDWSGQVTPLKINDTAGLGRFITISEAALIFHRPADPTVPAAGPNGLQAVLALEMATPMAGFPGLRETYYTEIVAVTPLTMAAGSATPVDARLCPVPMINICNLPAHEISQGRSFMPGFGFQAQMHYFQEHKGLTALQPFNDPDTQDKNRNTSYTPAVKIFDNKNASSLSGNYIRGTSVKYYPYVSDIISVKAADTTFSFTGPEFIVKIYSGEAPDDGRRVLVQTIHLAFPPPLLKLPIPTSNTKDVSFGTRFTNLDLDGTRDVIRTAAPNLDVVRSIEFTGPIPLSSLEPFVLNKQGDIRLGMAKTEVFANYYSPRDGYTTAGYLNPSKYCVHGLTSSHGDSQPGHTGAGSLAKYPNVATPSYPTGTTIAPANRGDKQPMIPTWINGVRRADGGPGDFDRGLSKHLDGALANKVDEGNIRFDYPQTEPSYKVPYYHGRNIEDTGQSFFTPNRQMPSVVMIGSLPVGVKRGLPWQTLLFRPDRETGRGHPGASDFPPDHLMLDLFHLPVVEPYAISEPFSTAGKVNMNYVIAPFGYAAGGSGVLPNTNKARSYLRRDSALRGVLKSTFVMGVPSDAAQSAHTELATTGVTATGNYRSPIDLDKTIEEFEERLNDQRDNLTKRTTTLFRSASEICEIDLFPKGTNVTNWNTYWENNAQTGDNMRERPYAHIYPRLTTKSNVYTVHMRCQSIRKAPGSKENEFDPNRDQVLGEYRGSAVIERFIDPNDETLSRYDEKKDRVDAFYRYRVVSTKQFAPH